MEGAETFFVGTDPQWVRSLRLGVGAGTTRASDRRGSERSANSGPG